MRKLVTCLCVFVIAFTPFIIGYSVNYPNDFQSVIDQENYPLEAAGYYIYADSDYGKALVLVPVQYIGYLTVTPSGDVYNISNSTIRGSCYVNGTKYDYIANGLDYIQYAYQSSGYQQSYRYLYISNVIDTNIEFNDANINDNLNSSVYFTKFEKAVIISLVTIIFLLFLEWFLLHKL